MSISPDEKYLASLSIDGILKFWQLVNFTMVDQLQDELTVGGVGPVQFTTDGRFLVVSLPKQTILFRYGPTGFLLESKTPKTFNPSKPNAIAEEPLSKVILTGDADGTLRLYSIV